MNMSEITHEMAFSQQPPLELFFDDECRRLIVFVDELDCLIQRLDIAQQQTAELFRTFDDNALLKKSLIQREISRSAAEKRYARLIGNHVIDTDLSLKFGHKVKCLEAAGLLKDVPTELDIIDKSKLRVGDIITAGPREIAIKKIEASLRMIGADDDPSVAVCLDLHYGEDDDMHIQQVLLRSDFSPKNITIVQGERIVTTDARVEFQ